MRRWIWMPLACGALMLGCAYDPTGACQDRCANAKADGCIPSSSDCVEVCSGADDTYDNLRRQAADAGCVSQYEATVACYNSTPACASAEVIAEMCAEEGLTLQHCVTP